MEAAKTFRRKASFEEVIILSFWMLFNDQTCCKDIIPTDVDLTTKGFLGNPHMGAGREVEEGWEISGVSAEGNEGDASLGPRRQVAF